MTDGCHLFQESARCPGRATCWSAQWRCWCCASAWASARRGTSPRIRTRIPCAFDNRDTRSRFTPTPRQRRPPRSPSSRFVDHRACCVHAPCVSMRPYVAHPGRGAKRDAHMSSRAYINTSHVCAGCFCLSRRTGVTTASCVRPRISYIFYVHCIFRFEARMQIFAISRRFNAWFNANALYAWLTPSHWRVSCSTVGANAINERHARNIIHR